MSILPPEHERFKTNIISLISLVKLMVSKAVSLGKTDINVLLVDFVSKYIETLDPIIMIDNFIKRSYNHWSKIKEKDKEYFAGNASDIFYDFDKTRIKKITELSLIKDGDKYLFDAELTELTDFFTSFVKISIKYIAKNKSKYPNIVPEVLAKEWCISI
jgi:hypothetical protein